MRKTFTIDTNVILTDSEAIFKFEENNVVIPLTVVEEIDKFKRDKTELGSNARAFSRHIDSLREIGDLRHGVKVNTQNGKLYVIPFDQTVGNCLPFQDMSIMDNRILATAKYIETYAPFKKEPDEEFVFVSKDINLRIRADIFGLNAEDYLNNKVQTDELYTGHETLEVTKEIIEAVYENKKLDVGSIFYTPYPNQCFTLKEEGNSKHSALVRYNSVMKEYRLIPQDLKTSGILPKNTEQQFALDMLNDPNLKLVTIGGLAGSGKTCISLAAGLRGVLDLQEYDKILLLKPIVPMDNGHELGFLPGDMNEKLSPWMASYSDNIEVIMSKYFEDDEPKKESKKKESKKKDISEKEAGKINPVQELMSLGLLEFGSLEHMRGRSLPKQWILIDEGQNLSQMAIKTLLTRVGEGTKIVVLGDITQIDVPYMDSLSNGLSHLVEAFKDQEIAGHITLKKSERSKLAEISANIL